MANQQNANPTLPSAFEVFRTDPQLDKIERIVKVEAMLLATFGPYHVPMRCTDGAYVPAYFGNEADAKRQRCWRARAIVEAEIIEERRREYLDALAHPPILLSLREAANRQMAQYEREGRVTISGY
jgi:hypothetical protein